jgi:hypothetical protein
MEDGTIVDTAKASGSWIEDTYWDGRNHISQATGSQWEHEQLYRSAKGRYWLEHWSQWQGSHARAEWLSREEAARWLLENNHPLPDDLAELEKKVAE